MLELGERDEGAIVTVSRISVQQGMKKSEWLFQCHPSEFSIPSIQEFYGAGDYRVTVRGRQEGSNYQVIHADKKISIGEARSGAAPKAIAGTVVPASPQSQDLTRSIAEAISAPLQSLTQALAGMIPKQSSRADALAELSQMAQLLATMNGGRAAQPDPLEMLTRTLALVKESSAAAPLVNEDGEIPPNNLIAQGIGLVKSFLDAARSQQGAQAPAPVAQPGAAAVSLPAHVPAAPAVAAQPEDDMGLMLTAQMGMLLAAAKANGSPDLYAGLIYENAPDEVLAALQSENWWGEVLKLAPGFAPYKPWAESVRAALVAIVNEESAPEPGLTGAAEGRISSTDAPVGPAKPSADTPSRNP
jgi:hypothetical protein